MNHIELFAGCGGLSLGLETAGFDLLVANELSPMASETFAYNHLNADLESQNNIDKVFWVSSNYSRSDLKLRLRENPYEATGLSKNHYSDLLEKKPTNASLKRSLLVGSIIDINSILNSDSRVGEKNGWLLKQLRSGLGSGGVDLVSGGPPCQSFSLAGMRDHSHHRNKLPGEFAKFVGKIKPRIALLENVSGILRAFTIDGEKHYPWFEVAKAFAKEGYIPLCLHVNAKYVGTAQNRPRFILVSLRKDVYESLKIRIEKDDLLMQALKESEAFLWAMKKIKLIETRFEKNEISKKEMHKKIEEIEPKYGSLKYFDVKKDEALFENPLLSALITHKNSDDPNFQLSSVKDAIDDLHHGGAPESKYVDLINRIYIRRYNHPPNKMNNHELRENKGWVRARFRIYQILNKLTKEEAKEVKKFLKNSKPSCLAEPTIRSMSRNWLLNLDGKKIAKPTKGQVREILSALHTKKQTQKALIADEPAPAALSIPDDACHYHESKATQRTLTVREMTRIQSFPDWYEIKSKVTTGGQKRNFEVPQYTQIGNAVPPLLGIALGEVCKKILDAAN
jgi:DNA (cytosine-5)-methyltransferase 1